MLFFAITLGVLALGIIIKLYILLFKFLYKTGLIFFMVGSVLSCKAAYFSLGYLDKEFLYSNGSTPITFGVVVAYLLALIVFLFGIYLFVRKFKKSFLKLREKKVTRKEFERLKKLIEEQDQQRAKGARI